MKENEVQKQRDTQIYTIIGACMAHDAQVINYLKVISLERVLLINFGTPKLQYNLILSKNHLRKSATSADNYSSYNY